VRRDGDAGCCVCVGVGGDVADVGAIGFLGVIAGFEIATRSVVCLHAAGRDPFQIAMRGDWGVGFIEVAINVRVTRETVGFGAVGEVVDVFRASDVTSLSVGLPLDGDP
jgi:hypothetical protein